MTYLKLYPVLYINVTGETVIQVAQVVSTCGILTIQLHVTSKGTTNDNREKQAVSRITVTVRSENPQKIHYKFVIY